ncbi:MAG: phage tail domain-containing protein [Patescibacteria group bacterium]
MYLEWTGYNGDTLVIADPSFSIPTPPFRYITLDGFGGPDYDIQTLRGAYQDGAAVQNVRLMPRNLMIRFLITSANREDVELKRKKVATAFNTRYGYGTLIWTQESGERYGLRCWTQSGSPQFISGRKSQGKVWQEVTVDLVAPDPCWYDADAETLLISSNTGGLSFPASFPASFGVAGSTLEIMNTGDIASPIHVEIPGPCTNPNLENLSTNEIISLTLAVADGETVVIDTTYSALYCRIRSPSGTESNAMQYLTDDSTFWQIIPGINIVTYTAASGSGTVTIKCPSRYTGI